MSRYRFTPQAEGDLFEIWSYIARDSLAAANKVESAIYDACAFLAEHPEGDHELKDLTPLPLRFWTLPRYRNYIVVYDPDTTPLQVIRVFHGARNVRVALQEKGDA